MLGDQSPVAANDLEPHHSHDALLSDLERKASATGHGKESRRVVACLPDQQGDRATQQQGAAASLDVR